MRNYDERSLRALTLGEEGDQVIRDCATFPDPMGLSHILIRDCLRMSGTWTGAQGTLHGSPSHLLPRVARLIEQSVKVGRRFSYLAAQIEPKR